MRTRWLDVYKKKIWVVNVDYKNNCNDIINIDDKLNIVEEIEHDTFIFPITR